MFCRRPLLGRGKQSGRARVPCGTGTVVVVALFDVMNFCRYCRPAVHSAYFGSDLCLLALSPRCRLVYRSGLVATGRACLCSDICTDPTLAAQDESAGCFMFAL